MLFRSVTVAPTFNVQDTAAFNTSLSKSFANGGQATVSHTVNYLNQQGSPPSTYAGNVQVGYRHPLLAGSGTEFTRIAGPITRSFGGITGVSQGVVIARINNDLVLCDYENALRNLTKDIEDAYWDLYLAYRTFDTATQTYEYSLDTWRKVRSRNEGGVQKASVVDLLLVARDLFLARGVVLRLGVVDGVGLGVDRVLRDDVRRDLARLGLILEDRVLEHLLLHEVDQLHSRHLQQLDRLLELRRHDELLGLAKLLLDLHGGSGESRFPRVGSGRSP